MKNLKCRIIKMVALFLLIQSQLFAQAIYEEERYIPETDPLVLEKLDEWQGKKFGLLMHWAPSSQWGIIASWSLCPESYDWIKRTAGENPDDYFAYKKEYEELRKTFNPVLFNPDKWAKAAKNAGMKYVVFTTKHHDGFSMFDSKYTDYKVTDSECAFSSNPKANITKEIFKSFRNEGLWVGAYFSKPDWNNKYYWSPKFPPLDRNVNYDPNDYPEKWQNFVDFTHNQILELLTDYGKVDILWLDGGWVSKASDEETEKFNILKLKSSKGGFMKHKMVNQDIKMDELVLKARKKQPGLIVVDRAVHGKNQNYLTPENHVPDKTLPYPWESCITTSEGWSYRPNAKYMSGREGIHMLIDIVAKGGNLLLNIGPRPDGEWDQGAYDLLNEYGDWMKINSLAIYATKPIAPFKENNICMTQNKEGNVFLFYLAEEGETIMPAEIIVNTINPAKYAKVKMLGSKYNLKWKALKTGGFKIFIPKKLRNNPPSNYAWTFKISDIKKGNFRF